MTSSAQLQREADAARVGLADTLGQLRDGVAPSALSGEAIALVKDSGLSILKSLADSARANPGAGAADRCRPHHAAHPHHGRRRDGRGDLDPEERRGDRRRCRAQRRLGCRRCCLERRFERRRCGPWCRR